MALCQRCLAVILFVPLLEGVLCIIGFLSKKGTKGKKQGGRRSRGGERLEGDAKEGRDWKEKQGRVRLEGG